MENINIRPIKKDELHILENLLYEAIFQSENSASLPFEIIYSPDIYVYIEDWGKSKNDLCLIGEIDGKIVGGVWTRILAGEVKGYGNIDNTTPEFAISLFKEFRKKGYGTLLMAEMINLLKQKSYKRVSLSVNKENYAARMYKNLGFEVIKENEEDLLMVLNLEK
ncbi:MAG: GNAT family N-acetyltransferase [Dysgonomonas sp.]|nr:GNAT family N-acetyltransferase [Dysgonomonas sp.]